MGRGVEEVKEAIIKAAMEVFAEYGYFRAPVRLISLKAGVSKGLIFWYFRGKDELIREVALRALPRDVISKCLNSGVVGCALLECIAKNYTAKYSDKLMTRLLLNTLAIKEAYPAIAEEIDSLCENELSEVARRALGGDGKKERMFVRFFFGSLLCPAINEPSDVGYEELISFLMTLFRRYCEGEGAGNEG